jgi:hypothetical protein
MARGYLPEGDLERVGWLLNFSDQLVINGSLLDFSPAEILSIQNDAQMARYAVTYKEDLRKATQSYAAFTNSLWEGSQVPMGAMPFVPVPGTPPPPVLNGILKRIQVYVKRIRLHANYTETLGIMFRIAPKNNAPDLDNIQPVLTIEVKNSYPILTWNRSRMHGVHIYVDKQDGNGFMMTEKRTSTSFTDTSPLPAGEVKASRTYKIRYILNDDEVGKFSEGILVELVRA